MTGNIEGQVPFLARLSDCGEVQGAPFVQKDGLANALLALCEASSLAVNHSLEYLLDSTTSDHEQSRLIDRAFSLASFLLDAANRVTRKRALNHNSSIWVLPDDLTVNVFSLLDTSSVCRAAVTCSFFRKCAGDPLCYRDIDLTGCKLTNGTVSEMVRRAGRHLCSLKLVDFSEKSVPGHRWTSWTHGDTSDSRKRQMRTLGLTRNCLASLSNNGAVAGARLERLHLRNIVQLDAPALCLALSACPSLRDLELIALHVELRQILVSVSESCHMIERLVLESSKLGRDESLKSLTCIGLINNCPEIRCLGIRGFKLQDNLARKLVKGFHALESVDFSTSYALTGSFLRDLGRGRLELLLLRDCMHLKLVEVTHLLSSILVGDFRLLRLLDVSNKEGLAGDDSDERCCLRLNEPPFVEMAIERPRLCVLAEFPPEQSMVDFHGSVFDEDESSGASSFVHTSSDESTSVSWLEDVSIAGMGSGPGDRDSASSEDAVGSQSYEDTTG